MPVAALRQLRRKRPDRRVPSSPVRVSVRRPASFFHSLSAANAAQALSIHQPVQELGICRYAPVILFALSDVRVQVAQRFHVHRLEASDGREAFNVISGQPNVVSKGNHRRQVSTSYRY